MKRVAGFLLVLAIAILPTSASEPLRDEDIVRMFVSGDTTDEIISRIRNEPTEFDISDDMLDELRIAGLPEAVIEAMIERQREQEPEVEDTVTVEEVDDVTLDHARPRIVFEISRPKQESTTDDRRPPVLRFPALATPDMAKTLELGIHEEDREVTGAAYLVMCLTPEHVPDHWRNETPLGRDFFLTPRHRMLAFHPTEEVKEGKKVKLVLPLEMNVELDAGTPHDLLFGIAVEIGGRYYLLAEARIDRVLIEKDGMTKQVMVDTERDPSFEAEIRIRE